VPVHLSDLAPLSAAELFQVMRPAVQPSDRKTVSAYAALNRFVSNAGGGRGERWSNERTPYLVEPMDMLTARRHQTLGIVGPGQVGKTVVPENWLLHSVAADPGNMLWYMQSDEALEAYVKDRINPMIDDHDELDRAKGPRAIDDSLHYKKFRGMSVQFLTASMANLISKTAPRIVADEIDAYKKLFGNVKNLLDIRRQTFGDDSMLLAISHPDMALGLKPEKHWGKGIMAIYGDSTRCMWWWPCPSCGDWCSPCPLADRYMSIAYKDQGDLAEVEASAHLLCPTGCVVEEEQRLEMNRAGRWIGAGEEIRRDGKVTGERIAHHTGGYWIVGAMSPFVLGGIRGLARNRVQAEREMENSGDDDSLRQVIVKQWGFPYERGRRLGSIDANDLADRAEQGLKLGTVPDGVRFITVAVDVQLNSFEWLQRGWGVGGESWVINRGTIKGEPCTNDADWDKLLEVFAMRIPLADGSGRTMVARACGFDSAGAPGVTEKAYEAWRRWRKLRKITLYGQVATREAWSVLPLKGASGFNAPRLVISYPDTQRKANKVAGKGDVPIGVFNPNTFKDALGGQLLKGEPGPGYVHFPWELRSKQQPHGFFEQVVAEQQLPNGRWEKIVASAKNENLDLLVMTHIMAHLHGLARINWEKPPAWADVLDKNALVMGAPQSSPDGKPLPPESPGSGAVKITIDAAAKKSIGSRLA
jgi:phage terminase large subunit GpA-like protein